MFLRFFRLEGSDPSVDYVSHAADRQLLNINYSCAFICYPLLKGLSPPRDKRGVPFTPDGLNVKTWLVAAGVGVGQFVCSV